MRCLPVSRAPQQWSPSWPVWTSGSRAAPGRRRGRVVPRRWPGSSGNPGGWDTPERRLALEDRLGAKARQLVARVVLPGEWYLVRWGGTRKGSGSFYTRPGLAVPTVQRTLRPLAFDPPAGADGTPDRDAPPASWTPSAQRRFSPSPYAIPPVGPAPSPSQRFASSPMRSTPRSSITAASSPTASVPLCGCSASGAAGADDDGAGEADPAQQEDEALGAAPSPRLGDELIPCPPDDERFEPRLKAVLRRHVVERCIYAVDLDPLAVELCRLSLWIVTMDRTLPFGFLDHKVKCGNALVGAWFDQFRHYPVMAWKNREGGDKNHANGVHFEKGARTAAIKAFVKDRLTPDLKLFLQGRDLFQEDLPRRVAHRARRCPRGARGDALPARAGRGGAGADLPGAPSRIPNLALAQTRDGTYGAPAGSGQRRRSNAPPLPRTFVDPPAETRAVAKRIAAEMHFFHWELEFPDVFRESGSGFDAILGNPPWENLQANPEEFFSNEDPLFRTNGRLAKKQATARDFRNQCSLRRAVAQLYGKLQVPLKLDQEHGRPIRQSAFIKWRHLFPRQRWQRPSRTVDCGPGARSFLC